MVANVVPFCWSTEKEEEENREERKIPTFMFSNFNTTKSAELGNK
jgi:hypothetical protein